jgi:hypothetical protein
MRKNSCRIPEEEVELINQADNLAYATEKSLKDYGDKVSRQSARISRPSSMI